MRQNLCKSFLLESLEGIHDFRVDQMKLALYTSDADLDPETVTAYTATDEVSGSGYTAGGFDLAVASGYPKLSDTAYKALVDFDDVAETCSGFTMRRGIIYNSDKSNRAVAVVDFGVDYVVTSSLGIQWPPPSDSQCLIRLGA